STVRWATATDVAPGASSKCAMLPRPSRSSTRTWEPSGATASGCAGSRLVSNLLIVSPWSLPRPVSRGLRQVLQEPEEDIGAALADEGQQGLFAAAGRNGPQPADGPGRSRDALQLRPHASLGGLVQAVGECPPVVAEEGHQLAEEFLDPPGPILPLFGD